MSCNWCESDRDIYIIYVTIKTIVFVNPAMKNI